MSIQNRGAFHSGILIHEITIVNTMFFIRCAYLPAKLPMPYFISLEKYILCAHVAADFATLS